jgi:hypothetical protein
MSEAILYATATPVRQAEPSVPPELERIIARAMARELSQRYASAGELHTDLRALQATLATNAPSDAPEGQQQQRRPTVGPVEPHLNLPQAAAMEQRKPHEPAPAPNPAPNPLGRRTLRSSFRPASLEPAPTDEQRSPRAPDAR